MGLRVNWALNAVTIVQLVSIVSAAPAGFPKSGNGLWYTQPGTKWSQEYLPVGNGYLAGQWLLKSIMFS